MKNKAPNFRGLTKRNKYIYGDLIHDEQGDEFISYWELGTRYDVEVTLVERNTHVVDIKGRDIFEGDYVRHKLGRNFYIEQVEYDDKYGCFTLRDIAGDTYSFDALYPNTFEVVCADENISIEEARERYSYKLQDD